MKDVVSLKTVDGKILFVEVLPGDASLPEVGQRYTDMPTGAEPTSAASKLIESLDLLGGSLDGIASTVRDALARSRPDVVELELSVGFKGKTSPIPVILSGEADAALKLKITWKKSESDGN